MNKNLNFAFWGTPDVAEGTLEILKEAGYIPSLIITAPDKPQGRKMILTPPPVKVWAEKNNVPFIQPEKLNDFRLENNFDLSIVVAYGKIIPENILNAPKLGSINIHYSLLPKYRGAAPVEAAILNGDTETGVSIQKMFPKLDAGHILAQEKVKILPDETAPELRLRLIKIGGNLLVKLLQTPSASGISPFAGGEKQNELQATYCKKIKKEDGLIDLNDDPVKNYNKFRAHAAWPRTFFLKNNKRVIITSAKFEDGKFVIEKVLPEGKKEQNYKNSIYAMA